MDAPKNLRKQRVPKLDFGDIGAYRKLRAENQSSFWARFGVTQSGGSRYESGRGVPKPVRILMALFADGKVTDDDLAVAAGAKPKPRKG